MYDFDWHERHGEKTRRSAEYTLSLVRDIFEPNSILDVGCGDGTWLRVAKEIGLSIVQGVDGPWTRLDSLKIPKEAVQILDLQSDFTLPTRFDLAISLEVAEHLPQDTSDSFVEALIRHSDLIIFGAAIPYQGGYRHLNEQWQSFWCDKFARRGFRCFDLLRPFLWWKSDVHYWYKQNSLVYVSDCRLDLLELANNYIRTSGLGSYPLNLVHPEKYEAIASYNQIAFRPLSRKLPARLVSKLKDLAFQRT